MSVAWGTWRPIRLVTEASPPDRLDSEREEATCDKLASLACLHEHHKLRPPVEILHSTVLMYKVASRSCPHEGGSKKAQGHNHIPAAVICTLPGQREGVPHPVAALEVQGCSLRSDPPVCHDGYVVSQEVGLLH